MQNISKPRFTGNAVQVDDGAPSQVCKLFQCSGVAEHVEYNEVLFGREALPKFDDLIVVARVEIGDQEDLIRLAII